MRLRAGGSTMEGGSFQFPPGSQSPRGDQSCPFHADRGSRAKRPHQQVAPDRGLQGRWNRRAGPLRGHRGDGRRDRRLQPAPRRDPGRRRRRTQLVVGDRPRSGVLRTDGVRPAAPSGAGVSVVRRGGAGRDRPAEIAGPAGHRARAVGAARHRRPDSPAGLGGLPPRRGRLRAANLPWYVLAGIGKIESNHGRYGGAQFDVTGTVHPSIFGPPTAYGRAMGPMQFIPPTWASYAADGNNDDITNPQNIFDATKAAAHYLCKAGGPDLSGLAAQRRAVFAYNHLTSYVDDVLAFATAYQHSQPETSSTWCRSSTRTRDQGDRHRHGAGHHRSDTPRRRRRRRRNRPRRRRAPRRRPLLLPVRRQLPHPYLDLPDHVVGSVDHRSAVRRPPQFGRHPQRPNLPCRRTTSGSTSAVPMQTDAAATGQ